MIKSVNELTLGDLADNAVWELVFAEETEKAQHQGNVRPYVSCRAVDPADGMFIIRARFLLADGTRMVGYLAPPLHCAMSIGTIRPVVVTPKGQVSFWCGILAPSGKDIARCYARLGISSCSRVFPVAFESDVPLIGGPVRGEVPGFLVLDEFSRHTRTVT